MSEKKDIRIIKKASLINRSNVIRNLNKRSIIFSKHSTEKTEAGFIPFSDFYCLNFV